jgi:hypothetical protein
MTDRDPLERLIGIVGIAHAERVGQEDEFANAFAHTAFDRVKPVVEKMHAGVGC